MKKPDISHADVKIHPPILTLIHIALAYALTYIISLPVSIAPAIRLFGFALVVIGFVFGVFSFLAFRKARTTLNPHGNVSAIVDFGVYRFSRNPIYLGFALMLVGIPLNGGSLWGLVLLPIFIWSMNKLVIEKEEAYLEKKFREVYTSYKSRVRRWL